MLPASEIFDVTRRTLLIGAAATALATPPALLLALLLARGRFPGRVIVQTLVTLPLVVPPVAVGLLLLSALSPLRPWARGLHALLGGNPLWTWRAAVIAAAVMGAPLLIRTAEAALAAVPRRLEHVAATLGASPLRVFLTVTLPLAARGVLYGVLLCFLRAVGEFGATVLVAGNIPGETQTLALAIYARTQAFEDREALLLTATSIGIAAIATLIGEVLLVRSRPDDAVRG